METEGRTSVFTAIESRKNVHGRASQQQPSPATASATSMDTDDVWGSENILMEQFMEDFDLNAIGEEENELRFGGADTVEESHGRSHDGGPHKRGKSIKKRRKQGISPTDPRTFYTDRLSNALCTGDIENVRMVMERYHEPDCVYIQRFTNNTPDLPGYREIQGRDQMLAFYKAFLATSPDCVVRVTDRQLNVYQDGTSYLISKINFSGAWLFRIFFSNIVRRTRSFINRTFFNRPTILNPFRSKSSSTESSSSTSSPSTISKNSNSNTNTAPKTKNGDVSVPSSFFSASRSMVSSSSSAGSTQVSSVPVQTTSSFPSITTDNDNSNSGNNNNNNNSGKYSDNLDDMDQLAQLQIKPKLPAVAEESPYLYYDLHLEAGKARDYESDTSVTSSSHHTHTDNHQHMSRSSSSNDHVHVNSAKTTATNNTKNTNNNASVRAPTPLSPLSVSSSGTLNLTANTATTTTTSANSNSGNNNNNNDNNSKSHSNNRNNSLNFENDSGNNDNNNSNNNNNEMNEILAAEAPWSDLPFTVIKEETVQNMPVPAPAALIVTEDSEVSVVPAHPKPFRVNVAISHVAHINAAGRVYKAEMFLKADVSISWWPASATASSNGKGRAKSSQRVHHAAFGIEEEEEDEDEEEDGEEEEVEHVGPEELSNYTDKK